MRSYRIYGWMSTGYFIYRVINNYTEYIDGIRSFFTGSSTGSSQRSGSSIPGIEEDWVKIPVEGHPPAEIF